MAGWPLTCRPAGVHIPWVEPACGLNGVRGDGAGSATGRQGCWELLGQAGNKVVEVVVDVVVGSMDVTGLFPVAAVSAETVEQEHKISASKATVHFVPGIDFELLVGYLVIIFCCFGCNFDIM